MTSPYFLRYDIKCTRGQTKIGTKIRLCVLIAQCQRSDWANHKTACKATKAEYLQADFSREHHPDVSYNMDSGKA